MFIILHVEKYLVIHIISAVGFVWKILVYLVTEREKRASSVPILATHFTLIITPLLLIHRSLRLLSAVNVAQMISKLMLNVAR